MGYYLSLIALKNMQLLAQISTEKIIIERLETACSIGLIKLFHIKDNILFS